ncbi:hypothetical protein ABPG74_000334 [Tetrahymena malaccensis]
MGMAGLGCAWNLTKNKTNINLLLLEKSQKVGGRATSNSRHGYTYDHGANYFTFEGLSQSQRVIDIIQKQLPTDDLVHITKELYLFDKDSKIYQTKETQQTEKLTYRKGLIQLAELIQQDQDLNVKFEYFVDNLKYSQDTKKWTITYQDKANNGNKQDVVSTNYILLTPPAPQIVDLFKKSEYHKKDEVIQIFEKCKYKKQLCLVIAFEKKIQDIPYFALLNEDRQHSIVWITVEDQKEGHVPENKSLIICQMSEQFSDENYEASNEVVIQKAKESLNKLMPQLEQQKMFESQKFCWVKRWRYALPNNYKVSEESLQEFQQDGLFFAGDFLIGRGRVLQAFEKGLLASDQIQAKL